MQLSREQVDYFGRIAFMRGVMAERMGLIGRGGGLLSEEDLQLTIDLLMFLEQIEDWAWRLTRQD